MATYYVDSVNGNDSLDGKSPSTAWRTAARLKARLLDTSALVPGDSILFKRGGTYPTQSQLAFWKPGAEKAPITVGAYGDGALPVIQYAPAQVSWEPALKLGASWIVADSLHVRAGQVPAIGIGTKTQCCIVRNCEVDQSAVGVAYDGVSGQVENCYIHDLVLMYEAAIEGAIGIAVFGHGGEFTNNRLVNCFVPSPSGGRRGEGCAFELYNSPSRNRFASNYVERCGVFTEFGADSAGKVITGNLFEHNVSLDTRVFFFVSMGGQWAVSLSGNCFRNNTVIEQTPHAWALLQFDNGIPSSPGAVTFEKNILCLPVSGQVTNTNQFAHRDNLYWLGGSSTLGSLVLDASEKVGDPRFVDMATKDLHLLSDSPCPLWGAHVRAATPSIATSAIQDLRDEAARLQAQAARIAAEATALQASAAKLSQVANLLATLG